LISAWKHILKANTSAGAKVAGDKLTPDERARLARNIKGYDISPDMVRLSLVNLYLHGFADPDVVEYDTLTQDDKWNELADVILANPPFMSPKGGIKPHKRFTVAASRSEVLFVDYMAEHLTATGRAAIVVPEGIIFQSGTAYKALRKMLVDTSLVAVVSLPAGVFNPYSGVKTSVLILDKRVHKQTNKVLFVKVQNDGFNLGAQRRAVVDSHLPEATRLLRSWMVAPEKFEGDGVMAQAVERGRIGEGGDFNLSGERYLVSNQRQNALYPLVPFKEVCTLEYGISLPKQDRVEGPYPVLGSNGVTGHHNTFYIEGPVIVVGRKGSAGEVTYVAENCTPIDTTYYVKVVNPTVCDVRYLYQVLCTLNLQSFKGGAGIPGLNRNDVYEACKIPLPPLEVQHQIVAEIEGYQKMIEEHRKAIDELEQQIKQTVNKVWGS
jgi:type I restriction enzyme M protein